MTHDELANAFMGNPSTLAVIELHSPEEYGGPARCAVDGSHYPCSTIQAIAEHFTPIETGDE
jgi:hypothetical protein